MEFGLKEENDSMPEGWSNATWKFVMKPDVLAQKKRERATGSGNEGTGDLQPAVVEVAKAHRKGIYRVENGAVDGPGYRNRWRFDEPRHNVKHRLIMNSTVEMKEHDDWLQDLQEDGEVNTTLKNWMDRAKNEEKAEDRVKYGVLGWMLQSFVDSKLVRGSVDRNEVDFQVIGVNDSMPEGWEDARWTYVMKADKLAQYRQNKATGSGNDGTNDLMFNVVNAAKKHRKGIYRVEQGAVDGPGYRNRWRFAEPRSNLNDRLIMRMPEPSMINLSETHVGQMTRGEKLVNRRFIKRTESFNNYYLGALFVFGLFAGYFVSKKKNQGYEKSPLV